MRPVKLIMSWRKTSTLLLVLVVAVVMITAGCTQAPPVTTPQTPVATPVPTTKVMTMATPEGNMTGIANPASVYCGQVGGKTEIKKDASGAEYGVCNFPNGTSCEEWALFRGECKPNATAINTTALLPVVNKTVNATKNMTVTANNTTVKK
jgi:putative hemolysin